MNEKRYMISDAAKKIDVEPHVLRYWEDEIGIEIPRNEMGHRYYRKEDIALLRSVRDLKEKGFQLKAIKLLLPDLARINTLDAERLTDLRERMDLALGLENAGEDAELSSELYGISADEAALCLRDAAVSEITQSLSQEPHTPINRLSQFRSIMNDIVSAAMETNNCKLIEELNQCLTASITREMDLLLHLREEREEERFRSIDRLIRERQYAGAQTAAGHTKNKKTYRKDSKFFRKHNVHI